jgi:hypothetical protein
MNRTKYFAGTAVAVLILALTCAAQKNLATQSGASAEKELRTEDLPEQFVFDWAATEEAASESVEEHQKDRSVSIQEEFAEPEVEAAAASQKVTVTLFKIKNWPEFKVEMKDQCKKIFGHKVCAKVPQAFERNCELVAFAEISHPTANTLRSKIEHCTRQAVAAGVLAGIYTGNLSAGAAALKAYLIGCLGASGVEQLDKISVKVRTETKCGSWKPR